MALEDLKKSEKLYLEDHKILPICPPQSHTQHIPCLQQLHESPPQSFRAWRSHLRTPNSAAPQRSKAPPFLTSAPRLEAKPEPSQRHT